MKSTGSCSMSTFPAEIEKAYTDMTTGKVPVIPAGRRFSSTGPVLLVQDMQHHTEVYNPARHMLCQPVWQRDEYMIYVNKVGR